MTELLMHVYQINEMQAAARVPLAWFVVAVMVIGASTALIAELNEAGKLDKLAYSIGRAIRGIVG